jgi:topoisomerase IV subunit B
MAKSNGIYDEKAVQTLDALEHIRLRTGMYIGRIGDGSNPLDGIYVLLKEVVDNSIDEFIMGHGRRIDIKRENDVVTVRDYGRGIPLGKVIECVSQINTGAKYNDDVFQFSVGLNGVGNKAVNALSSEFEVISYREGKFKRALFERGHLLEQNKGRAAKEPNGTFVRFKPDLEVFKKFAWYEEYIEHRLRYYAYLNAGLTLKYNNKNFSSRNGLSDLLDDEIGNEPVVYNAVHSMGQKLEFAFTHTNAYGETYFSFVNGQHTTDGGTHQSAFREGILKGVNEFSKKSFAGEDVRDGLIGAVSVKIQDPVFESQTKNKLGSTDVRAWIVHEVREQVVLWLHKDHEAATNLINKIKNNERIRKELSSIKKEARERAKKVAIRIPKLIDCKVHYNDIRAKRRADSTIFLTEGDSAGGAMIQSRDVQTQAIFSLKGKPLNTYGLGREAVYKNEELYNIMRALGIEEDLDSLRYNKVVIATDADVDGMHIRNLLLTYFLRYFEELVIAGHVYIFETPLFRVRNKKETHYCYSEEERDVVLKKLRGPEITRFKGLGEISPIEFKQFITDDTRLVPVSVRSMGEVNRSLDFFMGKNTPQRRDFIVENLIADID